MAGCARGGSPGGTSGQSEKPIVVLLGVDANTLDPARWTSVPEWSVMSHIFDTLVDVDLKSGEVVPVLAESWEQKDEVTWRFHLRKGVKFQNGEDFNADSVKFSLDRLLDPKAQKWFFAADADYDHSTVVDPYTIDVVSKQPNAGVLYALRYTFMVPKGAYESTPPDQLSVQPVGCGPYRLEKWEKDSEIRLVRWDGYWGQKPASGEIVFKPVPEASSRVAALLSGEADLIVNLTPEQAATVEGSAKALLKGIQGGRDMYVMIDCSVAPFDDVRARQALNYAVDKERILKQLFAGRGKVLAGIANSVWENTDLTPYPYDQSKALQLFGELGYTRGTDGVLKDGKGQPLQVALQTPSARYLKDVEVAQAVAADLKTLGMQVTVEPLEWSVYVQKQRSGTLAPLSLAGLGGYFNGIGELRWVNPAFHMSPRDGEIRWQDPTWVESYAQMRKTVDPKERKQVADELQKKAFEAAPWIFLYKQYDLYGVSKRLTGWEPRPDELVTLRHVSPATDGGK